MIGLSALVIYFLLWFRTVTCLFSHIFINDLVPYLRENCGNGIFVSNEINDLFALMYADDVAGFSDTINRLQKLINSLVTFSDLIGIKIHLG